MVNQSQFIEMTKATKSIKLEDVAKEIFAGGDKPKDYSSVQNGQYQYPVFSNGIGDNALLCFSKECRVEESAITVSARGTIGHAESREAGFTPVVRLLTLIPKDGYQLAYLKFALNSITFHSTGSSQGQLTAPDFSKYEIPDAPKDVQLAFESIVHHADKSKFAGFKSQFISQFGGKENRRISDVCDIHGGSTPNRKVSEFWEGGTIPWFTVEDIYSQGKYIYSTRQHITEEGAKKVYIYPVETVLICCTASVGENAITKVPMGSNQQFNGLTVKDKNELIPEFLLYVASTLKSKLLQMAGKTTINFVSRGSLETIYIPVPEYEEQQHFVDFVKQADKSKYLN